MGGTSKSQFVCRCTSISLNLPYWAFKIGDWQGLDSELAAVLAGLLSDLASGRYLDMDFFLSAVDPTPKYL